MIQIGICSSSSGDYWQDPTNKQKEWAKDAQSYAKVGDVIYGEKNDATTGHVGIVINTDQGLQIREAMPKGGVQTNAFEKWFAHWNWIGLVRITDDGTVAQKAADYAKNANGAYTYSYGSCECWCDDAKWYCSELVFKAYKSTGLTIAYPEWVYVTPATIYNRAENTHIRQWFWNWGGWHVDKVYDTISDKLAKEASGKFWTGYVGAIIDKGHPCCYCENGISNCRSY